MKTSLEVLNIISPPQEPNTRVRRTLSLQEVELLDGWFLILHTILKTSIIEIMHKFTINFVFHFYIFRLTSWIWIRPSTEELKFESLPFKMKLIRGLQFWTLVSVNGPNPRNKGAFRVYDPCTLKSGGYEQGNKFEGLLAFHREGQLKNFPFKMKGYLKNCPSCMYWSFLLKVHIIMFII